MGVFDRPSHRLPKPDAFSRFMLLIAFVCMLVFVLEGKAPGTFSMMLLFFLIFLLRIVQSAYSDLRVRLEALDADSGET